jgi:dihydroflavonol-4-reductase
MNVPLATKVQKMILVTGATGLVGSHLVARLLLSGTERIRVLVRNKNRIKGLERVLGYYSYDPASWMQGIEVAEGDLMDYDSVASALEGVSKVYHCAAMVSFDAKDREMVIQGNIRITANVVNGCLESGIRKLVHVSSTSATGTTYDGSEITEETEWEDGISRTAYAIGKFESEREVWRGEAEGLNVAIVNPAMVLGPGNWGESSTALIEKAYRGLAFYTLGINAWVDVRDVVEVMHRLMEGPYQGERYLLIGGNDTFRWFFREVAGALDRPVPRYRARRWMGELIWRVEWLRSKLTGSVPLVTRETARTSMAKQVYSAQKVEEALGFQFRTLEETIQWTCSHYLMDQKATHPET